MYIPVNRYDIGTVEFKDGEIVVSDPGYEPHERGNEDVKVKPGRYIAYAVYGEVPGWGERVIELCINHESTPKKKATSRIGFCFVDSGQCGFFEKADYEKYHPKGQITKESDEWYWKACRATDSTRRHHCGLVRSDKRVVGVLSTSGLGDGEYVLDAGYNTKNEITALRLRFFI